MGGHHKVETPPVPDWRIYKVQDVPELMEVQRALACHGLKDPWLRNEVWRYTECSHKYPPKQRLMSVLFRGFKFGLVAALATTAVETFVFGGHGDHGDHGHDKEQSAEAH